MAEPRRGQAATSPTPTTDANVTATPANTPTSSVTDTHEDAAHDMHAQSDDRVKVASGKVVRYIGTANRRVIDANAWKSIGVEDQKKVVWDKKNGFEVPVDDLAEGAVQYCDESDTGFVVVNKEVSKA